MQRNIRTEWEFHRFLQRHEKGHEKGQGELVRSARHCYLALRTFRFGKINHAAGLPGAEGMSMVAVRDVNQCGNVSPRVRNVKE